MLFRSKKNQFTQPTAPPPPLFINQPERDFNKQVVTEVAERVSGQPILYYPIDIDRTEFWANETGQYTLEQAQQLANSNASESYNSQKAKALLAETDWSEIPSVSASTSTPRLVNVQDYITYRVALRQIAINPTAGYVQFPSKPASIWA